MQADPNESDDKSVVAAGLTAITEETSTDASVKDTSAGAKDTSTDDAKDNDKDTSDTVVASEVWDMYFTEEQVAYYCNRVTQETTW